MYMCVCQGEQAKNDHARQIMTKILDEATWINTHQLPVILHQRIALTQLLATLFVCL